MVSDKGHLEWKKIYFKLSRCYPHREQYSDTLHFCTHCHILFWKVLCFILFHFALDQCRCETKMFLFLKQRGEKGIINSCNVFFLSGYKPPLHSQQPRKLHHVPLPSRLYQSFQILIPPTHRRPESR